MCVVNHSLYVGGYFSQIAGTPAKMIAMWDGTGWREVGGGVTDNYDPNNAIRSIIPDDEEGVFVAGHFHKLGSASANAIAHWDGAEWRSLGSGLNGLPYTLCLDGRDLYAFGEIVSAGIHPSYGVARWHLADLELIPHIVSEAEGFTFDVHGLLGRSFVLQHSSDFHQWQSISTNTLTAPKIPFKLPPSTGASQFFRLVTTP